MTVGGTGAPGPLAARDAYELWAPTYDQETALSALENRGVQALTPPLAGRALLDAGCGTGRRLPSPSPDGPSLVVGLDFVLDMLVQGHDTMADGAQLVAGDLRALPLSAGLFDVIWCRLALGHLPALEAAYREIARVAREGACVIVTDLHPEAARAPSVRTFRDADGALHAVEHHLHEVADHEREARRAGLWLDARLDLMVGPEIRHFYEDAGALRRYEEQRGRPVVLVLRLRN